MVFSMLGINVKYFLKKCSQEIRSDLVLAINVYKPDVNFHLTERWQNSTVTAQTRYMYMCT